MAGLAITAIRASNPRPAAFGFRFDIRLQVVGGKNATGPLKFSVFKNSVQLESPVAASTLLVSTRSSSVPWEYNGLRSRVYFGAMQPARQ